MKFTQAEIAVANVRMALVMVLGHFAALAGLARDMNPVVGMQVVVMDESKQVAVLAHWRASPTSEHQALLTKSVAWALGPSVPVIHQNADGQVTEEAPPGTRLN